MRSAIGLVMKGLLLIGAATVGVMCLAFGSWGYVLRTNDFQDSPVVEEIAKVSPESAQNIRSLTLLYARLVGTPMLAASIVLFCFTWPTVYVLWLAIDRLSVGPTAPDDATE